MDYLARSEKDGHPSESYKEHAEGVMDIGAEKAREIGPYLPEVRSLFQWIVSVAGEFHDLGKLDSWNQKVLHESNNTRKALPLNHVDAGAAYLISRGEQYFIPALAIYAHHHGLPNCDAEFEREITLFRDERIWTQNRTDSELEMLVHVHRKLISGVSGAPIQTEYGGDLAVLARMALSCLSSADYSDVRRASGKLVLKTSGIELLPVQRLLALRRYMEENKRYKELDLAMYDAFCDFQSEGYCTVCGKTGILDKATAMMAHVLSQAAQRKARRVFVLLPSEAFVRQAVNIYRNALCLHGEKSEYVVAGVYSQERYESGDIEYLAQLWKMPVIVTTIKAFFTTLASNVPYELQRLCEVPGSMIYVDELYTTMPRGLLSLAWHWIQVYGSEWGCYWLLASSVLVRFWEIRELITEQTLTPVIMDDDLQKLLFKNIRGCQENICIGSSAGGGNEWPHGTDRVKILVDPVAKSKEELAQWVSSKSGMRLVIMNTPESAVVIASEIKKKYGPDKVAYLSEAVLWNRDKDPLSFEVGMKLTEGIIVTDACIGAELKGGFSTVFREMSSVLALFQAVASCHGNDHAEVWSFTMQESNIFVGDAKVRHSAQILEEYFHQKRALSLQLVTKSIVSELRRYDAKLQTYQELVKWERGMRFQMVKERFEALTMDMLPIVKDNDVRRRFYL